MLNVYVTLLQIQEHITEQCSSNYDVAMIKDVANSVTEYLLNWLQHILVGELTFMEA